jgi:hypothetical protein
MLEKVEVLGILTLSMAAVPLILCLSTSVGFFNPRRFVVYQSKQQ